MYLSNLILIIVISTIITERLLEGLHRFYWTAKFKKYLVGDGDGRGILPDGPLREFIRCKFCQSFWISWAVTALMLSVAMRHPLLKNIQKVGDIIRATPQSGGGLIINTIWIGLVVGSLANKLHDLCDSIKAVRYKGL